ncbi:hypothetical protein ABZ341_31455 [Streptomyces sp. NPDC006173]|uniref:hypothetical protein n=1 Tax=Streptomyces sp. NPDC006173 TaxID=3155349 RepID=UPI0033CA6D14
MAAGEHKADQFAKVIRGAMAGQQATRTQRSEEFTALYAKKVEAVRAFTKSPRALTNSI